MSRKKKDSTGSEESSYEMKDLEVVLTRIVGELTKSFEPCMDRVVNTIEQKLTMRLDFQDREIHDLNVRLDTIEKRANELSVENIDLRSQIKLYQNRIDKIQSNHDDLEQYSRSDNLFIHGLPFDQSPEINLQAKVVDVINKNFSRVKISEADISVAHRVGRVPVSTSSSSPPGPITKTQPVVVRFIRRSVRNDVLASRKELKGKRLSITEQLTPARNQLLKKATELVGNQQAQAAWSHDGKILLKDLSGKITQLTGYGDILQFSMG